MKRIYIIFSLLVSGLVAFAQLSNSSLPLPASQIDWLNLEGAKRMPYMTDEAISSCLESSEPIQATGERVANVAPQRVSDKQNASTNGKAGYLNPAGTLFLGMDKGGKGTYFNFGGIVGAWSDTIPCWIWRNTTSGEYDSITYTTPLTDAMGDDYNGEYLGVDKAGNLYDTVTAILGPYSRYHGYDGDYGYIWDINVPLQTVKRRNGSTERFKLLSSQIIPTNDNSKAWTIAGRPSSNSVDGYYPMTNAVNINNLGISFDLVASIDTEGDGYVHYIFGSSGINTDTTYVPVSDENSDTGTRDSAVYTRLMPKQIITRYDRPQGPLYIKDITLAISCDGYMPSFFGNSSLVIDSLHLEIQDMNGNILASSEGDVANMSALTYRPAGQQSGGQMLTFHLQTLSEYGEIMDEGILLRDAFQVVLSGFRPTDNYGICAARSVLEESKTKVVLEDNSEWVIDYDPYIMLNGIYSTLENFWQVQYGQYREERVDDARGDTIPINMVTTPYSPYYKYIAHFKSDFLQYVSQFGFYSSFAPYDLETRYWNFDVFKPEYIELLADYEQNIYYPDDPISIWNYYRVFTLYIYATDTPKIGDSITLRKAGQKVVLLIEAINGATDVNPVYGIHFEDVKAEKVIQDGQVLIRKGNNLYNSLGIKLQ